MSQDPQARFPLRDAWPAKLKLEEPQVFASR